MYFYQLIRCLFISSNKCIPVHIQACSLSCTFSGSYICNNYSIMNQKRWYVYESRDATELFPYVYCLDFLARGCLQPYWGVVVTKELTDGDCLLAFLPFGCLFSVRQIRSLLTYHQRDKLATLCAVEIRRLPCVICFWSHIKFHSACPFVFLSCPGEMIL